MRFHIISAFLLTIAFSANAWSATYNTRDYRNHGDWASLELYLGNERTFRAANSTSYSDTNFTVDYYPGLCDSPVFTSRVEMEERYSSTGDFGYSQADFRVDTRDIQNGLVQMEVERGDSGLYFNYVIPDKPALARDMRNGQVLRIRITRDDAEPMFLEFSLRGSMAAMTRAASKCYEASQGPERFFDDRGSSSSSPESFF